LILTFLSTPLVNMTFSSQPLLNSSAQPASAPSAGQAFEAVYLLKFIVYTNSDWTIVDFNGTSPFAHNASVTLGADAPGLAYSSLPGHIWIGKKQYDPTPVSLQTWFLTLEGEDEGVVCTERGAMGETIVNISYYAGSWISLANFTNSGFIGNPLQMVNFTVDYSLVYSSPSGNATVEPVPSALNRIVLAQYYPWYLTLNGPGGMVWHTDGDYAHEPVFGRYDSMDERVIEAHIRLVKACGIDGFIVGFNGIGAPDERAVPAILRIADSLNFSISFYEVADLAGARTTYTAADVIGDLSHIIETYSSHKSFLKVDGMPVIFVYAVWADDVTPSLWSNVAKGLRSRGDPAYLIGDLGAPFPLSRFAEAFDGLHWYVAGNATEASQAFDLNENTRLGLKGIDWDQAVSLILQGKNLTLEEKFLAFTVQPGYDHRKHGGTEYLDRKDGKTYEEWWQAALSANPDGILITTWNEWHEGGEIEPSVEYGFTYLNLTRQFVSTYKGSSLSTYSSKLALLSEMNTALPLGNSKISVRLINNSSIPAIGVNLTLNLSEGLSIQTMERTTFCAYIEKTSSGDYSVIIPLLKSHETLTFNMTLSASFSTGVLSASAVGYSPSGVPSQVSFEKSVGGGAVVPVIIIVSGVAVVVLGVLVLVVRKRKH
jgi:hypothetical protein